MIHVSKRQTTGKQFIVGVVDWQTELEVSEQRNDTLDAAVGRARRAQFITFNQSVIVDSEVQTGDD